MKKLLVITGASGFVGKFALRFALEKPFYVVFATDINIPKPSFLLKPGKTFQFFQGDLTKPDEVERLVEAASWLAKDNKCEKIVVWHIGGLFRYDAPFLDLYNVNVLGTENLVSKLIKLRKETGLIIERFVFWSGGVVYGNFNHPKGILPATEEYPTCPANDYGWSKKIAEDRLKSFAENFDLPLTIMRLAAIYGPESDYGMANAFELNYLGKLAPLLVGKKENRGALIHVEDVIRVADFLSEVPESEGEIYNVVDDSLYTTDEISCFIGKFFNNEPFHNFHLPPVVLKYLIETVKKSATRLKAAPLIDPGLGDMVLLNSWMSNEKLIRLANKYNFRLKYGDSKDGLAATLPYYQLLFDRKYGRGRR